MYVLPDGLLVCCLCWLFEANVPDGPSPWVVPVQPSNSSSQPQLSSPRPSSAVPRTCIKVDVSQGKSLKGKGLQGKCHPRKKSPREKYQREKVSKGKILQGKSLQEPVLPQLDPLVRVADAGILDQGPKHHEEADKEVDVDGLHVGDLGQGGVDRVDQGGHGEDGGDTQSNLQIRNIC